MRTRDLVLETALERFRAQGYGKTSLREIAEKLGVTKAAVYYHFKAKADLLEALVSPFLEDFERLVSEAERAGAAFDASRLLARTFDVLLADRRVVSWLLRDFSALEHPKIGPQLLSAQDRLRALLVRNDRRPDATARAACAMGALFWPLVTLSEPQLDSARSTILKTSIAARGRRR